MSVFMLETDAVSSAASTIGSLASEVSNLSSEVSGYDTSCEDDFDFASAKNVISQNIEACSIKIRNTSNIMESVVNSHTQLQNSLTFNYGKEEVSSADGNSSSGGNSSGGGNSVGGWSSGGGNSSGGGWSSGGGSSGGYYPTGGVISGGGSGIVPGPTKPEDNEEEEARVGGVKTKLTEVGYAYADEDKLSDASKTLLNSKNCSFDDGGYAKIGDYFVIAADASVGKVGDLIKFTKTDGTIVACVIGINTKSDKYKNKINFIVDKEKSKELKTNDTVKNLLKDNEKVENLGNYKKVKESDIKPENKSEALKDGDNPSSANTEGEKSGNPVEDSNNNSTDSNTTGNTSSESNDTTTSNGNNEANNDIVEEDGTPSEGYDIDTDDSIESSITEEEEEL